MDERGGWLGSRDGTRLYWHAWLPEETPRAVAVIVHGVAEHGARYSFLAERLVEAGIAAYALDHRGHGRSDGPRGFISSMEMLVDDLRTFIERETEVPPFLIGHSLGGAVSIAYALRYQDSLAGVVLSGPAVATEAVSPAMFAISRVLSRVAPRLPVFKLDENLISRDPQVVQDYRDDPLVYPGKLPARTLWQILNSMRAVPEQIVRLRTPLLLLHGGEDALCPPSGSEMIYTRAGAADRTMKIFPGLYHEVFNEPERDEVVENVVGWLTGRTAELQTVNGQPAS
jgi:alpha-beta hydrolase superfamily lysophospholipase